MQTTVKPPAGMGMKDLIKLHSADKSASESTSSSSQKYVPSREEIKKIAKLIEKTTKMEVSELLKNGEGKVKSVSKDVADKADHEEMQSIFKKFIRYPEVLEQIRQKITNEISYGGNIPAFFSSPDNTVYLISDNFEQIVKKYCENRGLNVDSEEGRRIEKFLTLFYFTHEHVHQTVKRNNPLVGNNREDALMEQAKIISEHLEDEHKTPEKEETAVKSLRSIVDRMNALEAYNEGVTHYATDTIMCKLGYSELSAIQLRQLREDKKYVPIHSKGLRFVEAIQVKTHQNPIAFTINHPPLSMKYIENPDEYLKDREKGEI